MDAGTITTTHVEGDRFIVSARGHELVVDQPREIGGTDQGLTPTELFVASLSSCVAFFARRFLARRRLPEGQFHVATTFALSDERPSRVARIDVELVLPGALHPSEEAALDRVVHGCTVQRTLEDQPEVRIHTRVAADAAA